MKDEEYFRWRAKFSATNALERLESDIKVMDAGKSDAYTAYLVRHYANYHEHRQPLARPLVKMLEDKRAEIEGAMTDDLVAGTHEYELIGAIESALEY